jgi:pyruvate dehydrogenase E2 component (dihydrolipoamide acetyltransferase)
MATEVIMPKVDMVMETGTFVEWLKQAGDEVRKGDPLFVVLTDKANIEVEAPGSGILAGLKAQPDDVIPVTEIIAYILEPGEALPAEGPASPDPDSTAKGPPNDSEAGPVAPAGAGPGPAVSQKKVRATPAARRLAAELGVDLASVVGTGPKGRVHKANVLASAGQQTAAPAVPAAQLVQVTPAHVVKKPSQDIRLPAARQKEVLPLTGPRKIIAERLVYSAFTAPHINLSLRIDMTEATRLRNRVKEQIEQKTGRRLSFTAIVARAVAAVIPSHSYLNASVQGDQIIVWEDVHLGIATSLEDQLIVPVIRESQAKNLEQIVAELGDLVERARANRLTPAEMSGSTLTISNLGMFGIESFTAIINPPESAILAVGAIVDTPLRTEGEPEFRPMMNVTVSADHRIVDGAAVARFLAELKATLENPYLLI